MRRQPATCILASRRNGTLYIGVASNPLARVWQHRNHATPGFTARHGVTQLVWYEPHETMEAAISREKQLKKWNRAWKLRLIERDNPRWNDLWPSLTGQDSEALDPRLRGDDGLE